MYKECLNSINIRKRIKKEDKIRHLATCAGTITLVPHRYNLINDTEKQEKKFNHLIMAEIVLHMKWEGLEYIEMWLEKDNEWK
jgi:hypothetical protein